MLKTCGPLDYSTLLLEKLKQGVFLSSAADGKQNTMIIGWGGVNILWNKPMMVVLVRHIRATHALIEKSGEFTISIPNGHDLSKAIGICGTKSMKEVGDKFSLCALTAVPGQKVSAPIIGECGIHYECRVAYHQDLDYDAIPDAIKSRFYPTKAIHTLYFADILTTYTTEGDR